MTTKQNQIINYLYSFRFINTLQFQRLFNHRDPHRVKEWLKELKEKGYIATNYKRSTFEDGNKPAIHFLKPNARQILKDNKNFDCKIFDSRIYKEKTKSSKFVDHKLLVTDLYLYFLSKKEKEDNLRFFTDTDLAGYEYFPKTELCGYVSIKSKAKTKRYFLNIFEHNTPAWVYRKKVKQYLEYAKGEEWNINTDNAKFPMTLFICPNERMRQHIYHYAGALFEKSGGPISLYLTTKDKIKNENGEIWQKL